MRLRHLPLCLLLSSLATAASARAQAVRVSVSTGGAQVSGASDQPVLSENGRYIAFRSYAPDVVPGDTNGVADVFVHDNVARRTIRVSVAADGAEANGASGTPSISGDGRWVAFASFASNLVPGDTNGVVDVFAHDRDVDANGVFDEPGATTTIRVSVAAGGAQANNLSDAPAVSASGRFVAFHSFASNLAPGLSGSDVYRKDLATGAIVRVSVGVGGAQAVGSNDMAAPRNVMTADGRFVLFLSEADNLVDDDRNGRQDLFVRDVELGRNERVTVSTAGLEANGHSWSGVLSADATVVAFWSSATNLVPGDTNGADDVFVRDRRLGTTSRASVTSEGAQGIVSPRTGTTYPPAGYVPDISADGRVVAFLSAADLGGDATRLLVDGFVHDRLTHQTTRVSSAVNTDIPPNWYPSPAVSADGRSVAFASMGSTIVAGDTNGVADVFLVDLDDDGDGMPSRWETSVGLDPSNGADGTLDFDGDGVSNRDEYVAGSHPRGHIVAHFAEGASGSFFQTEIAITNPSTTPARVVLRFRRAEGVQLARLLTLPARSHATVDPSTVGGLEDAEFSTTVESDVPVVADRVMRWGSPAYGGHAETATGPGGRDWYLAEGVTAGGFDLFYLLDNDTAAEARVRIHFFVPAPSTPIVRDYAVPPLSRVTVWVDFADAKLAATEVAARIEVLTGAPVTVERAQYLSRGGSPFRAGHAAAAVAAPARRWFLAEGATGPYFDCFLPVLNPGPADATVEFDYTLPDGTSVRTEHRVPAASRATIWADYDDRRLADTAFSVVVASRDEVPIVVERVMWWPGPTAVTWEEAHASTGATYGGATVVMAGGAAGGPSRAETYLLVQGSPAVRSLCLSLLFEDGSAEARRCFESLPPGRLTFDVAASFPEANGKPFGAVIDEQAPHTGVPLVAEWARYENAGPVRWAVGMNAPWAPVPETYRDRALFDFVAGTNHRVSFDVVAAGTHPGPTIALGDVTVAITDGGGIPVFPAGGQPFTTNFLSKGVQDDRNNVVFTFPAGTRGAGLDFTAPAAEGVTVMAIDRAGHGRSTAAQSTTVGFVGFVSEIGIREIRISAANAPSSTPIVNVGGVRYSRTP
ncbi:MAG: hypothetical protein U0Q12_19920 [Vicinamibacterales bacterium]